MPDRVIKGLQNLRDAIATDYIHEADQAVGTIEDAIALLKEQETELIGIKAENNRIFSENIRLNKLLKEQEAKPVSQIRKIAYRTIGNCPSCGRGLDRYEDGNGGDHITNYCYNCGQKVKWE